MPRHGFLTGSRFAAMMTQGRGKAKWGKTSKNLAIRVAAERLGILELELDTYTNKHMEWGNEQEDVAIVNYERKTFTEVHGKQKFIHHPKFEYVGVTPDGLVGNTKMIEVKNPKSENHLLNILNGAQLKKYKPQCQGSLWVSGRDEIDFISHDSRLSELNLYIKTLKRDEEYIEKMEARYLEFENIVDEYKSKIQEKL